MNNEERVELLCQRMFETADEMILDLEFKSKNEMLQFVTEHIEELYEKQSEVLCDFSDEVDDIVHEYGLSLAMYEYTCRFGTFDRNSDVRYIGDCCLEEMFYNEYGGEDCNMEGFCKYYVDKVWVD